MVLMNGFYTSGKTNNVDLPQVAVPRVPEIVSRPTAWVPRYGRAASRQASWPALQVETSMQNWTWTSGVDSNPRTAAEPSPAENPARLGSDDVGRLQRARGSGGTADRRAESSSLASIGLSLSASGTSGSGFPVRLTGDVLTSAKGD
jgi:hypothetical protein